MAKAKAPSLEEQVIDYWAGRKVNGVIGLALLDKCIQRLAKHRDWDHLARFTVSAARHGQGDKVKKILRAAFGDSLIFKLNKKHATGGEFILKWQGEFNLRGSNTYGVISDAVTKGMSWDDRELSKLIPNNPPPKRQVTDEQKKKIVKHLAGYMSKLTSDGFSTGEILSMLQAELKKDAAIQSAPVGEVLKKMVNGAEVFEPNF